LILLFAAMRGPSENENGCRFVERARVKTPCNANHQ
jgi:hypothetical protein